MKTPKFVSVSASFLTLGILITLGATGPAIALGTPANPAAGSSFDQRLAQRKAEQNEQLNSQTQQRLQQQCTRYQGVIRNVQSSATTTSNNRTTTYQKIDGTLLVTIGQLKLAAQDTFNLEQNRATYVQKITNFQTIETNYLQTIGDALTINCQADPVGFQALLDTARVYNTQLASQSSDISSYLTNTVQPALQNYVSQLQQKSSNN